MKAQVVSFLAVAAAIGFFIGVSVLPPAHAEVTLEVLNPRGEIKPPPALAPVPRLPDLSGKRIGIYWNRKAGGNNFWDVVEEQLKEKFPTAKIIRFDGGFDPGEKRVAAISKEADTFLYGVGD
jgi:hypothetical protein